MRALSSYAHRLVLTQNQSVFGVLLVSGVVHGRIGLDGHLAGPGVQDYTSSSIKTFDNLKLIGLVRGQLMAELLLKSVLRHGRCMEWDNGAF